MDEKEIQRLKELEDKHKKDPESLNDEEKSDLEHLQDKKELQEGIKAGMTQFLKDSGLLKTLSKTPVEQKEDELTKNSGYVMHKLASLLANKDFPEAKAFIKAADPMTGDSQGDGGYLVPDITRAEILEKTPTFGQMRNICTVMPMDGNKIIMPKEGSIPTFNWLSGSGENKEIASSKGSFDTIELDPRKGAAIVVMARELLNDAKPAIGEYIIRKIAQAKGTAEDSQFVNGTGTPFTGIMHPGNTFGKEVLIQGSAVEDLKYGHLIDAQYGIDQNYLAGARWLLHRTWMGAIRKIKDDNGNSIFTPGNGTEPSTIMDYPFTLVENAPTTAFSS